MVLRIILYICMNLVLSMLKSEGSNCGLTIMRPIRLPGYVSISQVANKYYITRYGVHHITPTKRVTNPDESS